MGNTRQLNYSIGEIIKWGGNDISESNLVEVKVYGILEEDKCPNCENISQSDEFDIFIEKDIIKEIKLLSEPKDYFKNDNYKVIKK